MNIKLITQFSSRSEEEAQALGFENAQKAEEHGKWLEANGSPAFLEWIAEVRSQNAFTAEFLASA